MTHDIALLVVTDGRHHIDTVIPSALAYLDGPIVHRLIYDDSGDPTNAARLTDKFGPLGFHVTQHPEGRQGFGGAIRFCWSILRTFDIDFVFHLEDDFTFRKPVSLSRLAAVLDLHPHLTQLALRRQPWNDEERTAGGIVEQHPDDYTDCRDCYGNEWLEHRRFFTTNPSLYRRTLCDIGWPDAVHSEGVFTHQLCADPNARFGFWGSRESGEWVQHIGADRVGVGY